VTPHGFRIVRVRRNDADVVAPIAQAMGPHFADDPDSSRLGIVVIAPKLESEGTPCRCLHRSNQILSYRASDMGQ
jgi:hypothetical protein